jgi:hypothetical protein
LIAVTRFDEIKATFRLSKAWPNGWLLEVQLPSISNFSTLSSAVVRDRESHGAAFVFNLPT